MWKCIGRKIRPDIACAAFLAGESPCAAAFREQGFNHVFTMLEDGAQMTGADVLDITRDSLFTLLLVAGPLLLVALVVGFSIGLLQALTQIQEATLTFVPKLIAMVLVFILTAPLMGRLFGGLMERLAQRIISG